MKHCPKCNFTFADFYRVCDFDGAELIDDPERPPSSVKTSPLRSRFWQVLKSPLFLAGLGVVGLLASALVIGYYDSPGQSNTIVRNQPSQNSFIRSASPANSAQSSTQRQAQTKTQAGSTRTAMAIESNRRAKSLVTQEATSHRHVIASRELARLHSRGLENNQPGKLQTARQRDSSDNTDRKEPKLTAMLKTTWRVLKRPFKF